MEKKKLKKVSWAPGSKLCQVKLLPKADVPPEVCPKMPYNHPQPKAGPNMPNTLKLRKPSHFLTNCPSAYVPFKKESNVNQLKNIFPQIKWEIPPSFVLESAWLVASGEESEETKVQKLRESCIPEEVYPHICAIPPSPSISLDVEEDCGFDDSQTPVIPIIPIEEEAEPPPELETLQSKSCLPPNPSNNSKPATVEADTLLAAVAATSAIMKCMDPGSLIDTDLLVKFLKEPELTLQLINKHRLAACNVDSNTEPGRQASEGLVPMLTKPSMTTDTRPSAQPVKTATGENDLLGTSGQELQTVCGSISLSTGSSADLPGKKFNGTHSQTVNSEIVNLPNPISSPPIVAGSRFENAAPATPRPLIHVPEPLMPPRYSLPTSSPHIKHTDSTATVQLHCHVNNTEKVALVNETGLTTLRHSSFSNYASSHQEPLTTSGFVTEKLQHFPQSRMPGGLYTNSVDPLGTSSDYGSHSASRPTPVLNSELKAEHVPHNHVTKVHTTRNASQPDLSMFKRMVRDYGSPNKPTESEPLSALKDNNSARPIHQQSSGFGAPVFPDNSANVPQMKYFSYHQFLTKQQAETQNKRDHHHQQSLPRNTQSSNTLHNHKPKTEETCFYFNTPKGCRNGSTCLFRHEVLDQKRRITTTHDAPDAKRMKVGLGREIIGRT